MAHKAGLRVVVSWEARKRGVKIQAAERYASALLSISAVLTDL
jgi:hypothetical protein